MLGGGRASPSRKMMSPQVLLVSMKVWRSFGWFRSASFTML